MSHASQPLTGGAERGLTPAGGPDQLRESAAQPVRRPGLTARLRWAVAVRHYSERTAEAYVGWGRRFVRFHDLRHPAELGSADVAAFPSHLATAGRVTASTQNQAHAALAFLYREVLGLPLGPSDALVHAKRPARLPTVPTRAEVGAVLAQFRGPSALVSWLLYGGGLRFHEALRLRVRDVQLEPPQLLVRDGEGGKDRIAVLPLRAVAPLTAHLACAPVAPTRRRGGRRDRGAARSARP